MTTLVITGAKGQLGSDLVARAGAHGFDVVHAHGSSDVDITDAQRVRDVVAAAVAAGSAGPGVPAVVINAASYTAVDAAETDADRAYEVNAVGPGHLAAACADLGVPLVHVSTDYVFAGDATTPYEVDAPTGPRSVYGRTKLGGERAVLSSSARGYVVRTEWLYGVSGANFVKTMARLERSHDTLTVVDDQRGSPTWAGDLAAGLLQLAASTDRVRPGVLHATNSGSTTWHGFTRAIFEELGADPARVQPCTTEQLRRPAPRPAYSVLSPAAWAAAGLTPLRPWRAALAAAFAEDRAAYLP